MPIVLDGTLGITTPTYGGADTAEYITPVVGMKNRIINGSMMIDQRNAGASVSASSTGSYYAVDRTLFFQNVASLNVTLQQNTSIVPPLFTHSLGLTVTSAATAGAGTDAVIQQNIEGFNSADLKFGSSSASAVTLSFWVRSSLTGTYCIALRNSAFDRSYVAEYSISSANTWEYKTITIAGDTTGTWLTNNGAGIRVAFNLGSNASANQTPNTWVAGSGSRTTNQVNWIGTSSATFYITGVQLEKGSTATSFDYRPYGTELALCLRYWAKTASSWIVNSTTTYIGLWHQVAMRTTPTATGGGSGYVYSGDGVSYVEYQTTRANISITYNAEL